MKKIQKWHGYNGKMQILNALNNKSVAIVDSSLNSIIFNLNGKWDGEQKRAAIKTDRLPFYVRNISKSDKLAANVCYRALNGE